MGYFPVRYDSRVEIYDRKMFIRLATDLYFKMLNVCESHLKLSRLQVLDELVASVGKEFGT